MNYRSVIVLLAKNLSISSRVVLYADVKWVKKNWVSFMHKSEVIGENSPSIASPLWQFYKKNIRDNNMVKKVKKMNESIEHLVLMVFWRIFYALMLVLDRVFSKLCQSIVLLYN